MISFNWAGRSSPRTQKPLGAVMTDKIDGYDLKTLIDAQPVIVTVIDPNSYTVLFQNKTGEKKLGVIKNETCYEKIAKGTSVCPFCKMDEARRTGETRTSEVKLNEETWLLVQFAPVMRADGRSDIVETITDITVQKKREEAQEKTIGLLVDREQEIDRLRDEIKTLTSMSQTA
jgi:hypothetical protein